MEKKTNEGEKKRARATQQEKKEEKEKIQLSQIDKLTICKELWKVLPEVFCQKYKFCSK